MFDEKGFIWRGLVHTGRSAAASEHRTRNPAITSPRRNRYTNFVCTNWPNYATLDDQVAKNLKISNICTK